MRNGVPSVLCVLLVAGVSVAQQIEVETEHSPSSRLQTSRSGGRGEIRTATDESRNSGVSRSADQAIALALLLGNQEEVALAEFAQQRSQSPQVKEFAAMMIKDHQPAVEKLEQLASQSALPGSGSASTAGDSSSARIQTTAPNSNRARSAEVSGPTSGSGSSAGSTAGVATLGDGSPDAAQFQEQAAARCLELTKAELSQLDGEEFDMAYLGQQIVAHTNMLAKLETAAQMTSGDLGNFATQSIPTVKHHHRMAKQMKEQLKASSSVSSSADGQSRSAANP
jgi:predicted outer membrane protein